MQQVPQPPECALEPASALRRPSLYAFLLFFVYVFAVSVVVTGELQHFLCLLLQPAYRLSHLVEVPATESAAFELEVQPEADPYLRENCQRDRHALQRLVERRVCAWKLECEQPREGSARLVPDSLAGDSRDAVK